MGLRLVTDVPIIWDEIVQPQRLIWREKVLELPSAKWSDGLQSITYGRNSRCHGGIVLTGEQIIQRIKWDIRAKMGHVVMAGNIMLHKVLSSRWGCLHLVT